jgi:anti-sigma factor RsiW
MTAAPASEEELHAFLDGELDAHRSAEVRSYLDSSPAAALRLAALRRDAESLRAALAGIETWPPNPSLDPAILRRRLRTRTWKRAARAGCLAFAFGLAGLLGWSARGAYVGPPIDPMQDAMDAYRVFATGRTQAVEFVSPRVALSSWLSNSLGRDVAAPDLSSRGFKLLGGRLLATSEGAAGMVLYEADTGQRISFYIRPARHFISGTKGWHEDGELRARYWYRGGYGFAVVGRADDARTNAIQRAFPAATM